MSKRKGRTNIVKNRAEGAYHAYMAQQKAWLAFPPPRAANAFEPRKDEPSISIFRDADFLRKKKNLRSEKYSRRRRFFVSFRSADVAKTSHSEVWEP